MKININNIIVSLKKNQNEELMKEIEKKGIKKDNINFITWNKRSIDSRKKNDIKFLYNIEISLKKDIDITGLNSVTIVKEKESIKRVPLDKNRPVAVIGAGPAGLFAALRLVEYGYIPYIFERGEDLDKRDQSTENFIKTSVLNTESNIQFGEGGAGTYSDGKLNTRIKSEYIEKVFNEFVECGAPEQILWDYKPHIGTDILKVVVKNIRKKIIKMGGKFFFNTRVDNIVIKNNTVVGIEVSDCNLKTSYYDFKDIIVATGHSARDTYRMLNRNGVYMENKPFAIGARIEHPRKDIDTMQYGKNAGNELLGAATYTVTYNNKNQDRGVFSFCMCPGGEIVNASSEKNRALVNGMSFSTRDGKFSNSAIVVGVKENEFGEELFSGMKFQEKMESKTFEIINNYGALYQSVFDFIKNKKTSYEIESSYKMKKYSFNLNDFFPEIISENMQAAFHYWSKNNLFISKNANLIAPETRTSAPVKIVRDIKGMSININNLYPIGEGAGYAGGIVSAAVDGIKVVDLAFTRIEN
ncbi:NAD(P)/FAD-dependent oxidoreductase [Fusobacterium sp.]|uniref:NAD(P)/FAD-dependent oxidoreductase n=1 Tax=Fusobacterium sp. TaxID=68766 RepID=UPI00396C856B